MDAVRILEDEIREVVRRQGIDPQREHARVIALIQDAAADYESRAEVSALPDLEDPAAARQDLFDRIAGLGPLQRLMDDPSVEEIWLNAPANVRKGAHVGVSPAPRYDRNQRSRPIPPPGRGARRRSRCDFAGRPAAGASRSRTGGPLRSRRRDHAR